MMTFLLLQLLQLNKYLQLKYCYLLQLLGRGYVIRIVREAFLKYKL